MMAEEIRRFGLKYHPPTIVIQYFVPSIKKLRQTSLRLHHLKADSDVSKVTSKIFSSSKLLNRNRGKVSVAQVQRLVRNLTQFLATGKKIPASLSSATGAAPASGNATVAGPRTSPLAAVVPATKDLNKCDDDELKRIKAAMEVDFERNLLKPGDPGFEYDKQVEFNPTDDNEWDSDDGHKPGGKASDASDPVADDDDFVDEDEVVDDDDAW